MVLARTRRQRLFDRDVERESSAFGDGPSVLEQLREEERVRERNLALRRAAEAVDGGPNDIAKIDALVSGSPLAAPELARGRSEGERKPIAKSVASTLPMGIETYDSFNRERELAERNAPIRQALLSIGTDPDDPDFLGGDATPRTGGGTIQPAQEATPSRRVPLTDLPEWVQRGLVAQGVEIPGVAPGLGTVNPGPGGFDSPPMRTREEIARAEVRRRESDAALRENDLAGLGEVERSDPSVPERLIEIFKSPNLIFTREQLDFINGFSSETVARAQFIAIAESSGNQGEADALRRGGLLPAGDDGLGRKVLDPIIAFGEEVVSAANGIGGLANERVDAFLGELERQLGTQRDALQTVGDSLDQFGPTERTPHQIDDLRRELNEVTGASGGSAPDLRCLTAEGVERLHDGILAAVITDTRGDPRVLAELKQIEAFVAGVKGDIEPRGADHPALQGLPEGSLPRKIGGWGVEQVTDPTFIVGGALGKALKVGTWVAGSLAQQGVRELVTGACD